MASAGIFTTIFYVCTPLCFLWISHFDQCQNLQCKYGRQSGWFIGLIVASLLLNLRYLTHKKLTVPLKIYNWSGHNLNCAQK